MRIWFWLRIWFFSFVLTSFKELRVCRHLFVDCGWVWLSVIRAHYNRHCWLVNLSFFLSFAFRIRLMFSYRFLSLCNVHGLLNLKCLYRLLLLHPARPSPPPSSLSPPSRPRFSFLVRIIRLLLQCDWWAVFRSVRVCVCVWERERETDWLNFYYTRIEVKAQMPVEQPVLGGEERERERERESVCVYVCACCCEPQWVFFSSSYSSSFFFCFFSFFSYFFSPLFFAPEVVS